MSHDHEDDRFPVDAQLRDAYRKIAQGETPSPKLDAAILAAAARGRPRRLHGLLPPLAMAATVVLALGLILRLAAPTRDEFVSEPAGERASSPSALEREQLPGRAPTPGADTSVEESPRPATVGTAAVAPEPASDTPTTEQRLEAFRAPSVAPLPEAQQRAAVAPSASADALASSAAGPTSICNADDGDAWLTCIRELIDAGRPEEAALELEALAAAYPNLTIPDSIASAMER